MAINISRSARSAASLHAATHRGEGRDPDRRDDHRRANAPAADRVNAQRYDGRIQASVEEGTALGVSGTPTFFVNGHRYGGRSTSDDFKAVADSITKSRK